MPPMTSGECGNVSGFAASDTRAGMCNGSDRYAYRIVLIQSFRLIPNSIKIGGAFVDLSLHTFD